MKRQLGMGGFTLVELMFASAVFSVILLICTIGIIQISKVYHKGITQSKTQEAARSIMDEISHDIQFGGGRVAFTSSTVWDAADHFCVGDKQYSFYKGHKLVNSITDASDQTQQGLVTADDPTCTGPNMTASGSKELLGINQRIVQLKVERVPGTTGLYTIFLRVASGDRDLFNKDGSGYATSCTSTLLGGQFCAISELSTTVQKRVK